MCTFLEKNAFKILKVMGIFPMNDVREQEALLSEVLYRIYQSGIES